MTYGIYFAFVYGPLNYGITEQNPLTMTQHPWIDPIEQSTPPSNMDFVLNKYEYDKIFIA